MGKPHFRQVIFLKLGIEGLDRCRCAQCINMALQGNFVALKKLIEGPGLLRLDLFHDFLSGSGSFNFGSTLYDTAQSQRFTLAGLV